ncbi:hypothetical protein Y032_0057g2752 [Ancylostoma ceylanicum]|uniref:Uncharacterized protein n=1 Tax=Ancylostoma ceylanicum TaxID=53326 RepID=A0A016U5H8_9BILA|nr:hypothetical protein Y032_0057g2752 [Ancylostoma ceylanicum]
MEEIIPQTKSSHGHSLGQQTIHVALRCSKLEEVEWSEMSDANSDADMVQVSLFSTKRDLLHLYELHTHTRKKLFQI